MPPTKEKRTPRSRKDGTPYAEPIRPLPLCATSIDERDALEALASVLAPRVLRLLHEHVVDVTAYERRLDIEAWRELGYKARISEKDAAAEELAQFFAREAVRVVKAHYESDAPAATSAEVF